MQKCTNLNKMPKVFVFSNIFCCKKKQDFVLYIQGGTKWQRRKVKVQN